MPPPLPLPLLAFVEIVAYDCEDGKNIAFECKSDVADFAAVVPDGQFDKERPTIIHGG